MTFTDYLYDKLMLLFLNLFCAAALCIYLVMFGNKLSILLPILLVWAIILICVWGTGYCRLHKKSVSISHQLDQLDQKYLIFEMLGKPGSYAEKLFHRILRTACKSMLENVNQIKNSQRQYKEYIEEWIHEIKTPITAIDLICRNHPDNDSKRIGKELSHIDYLVEQALYYARSENVEKDYFVKKFPLADALGPALLNNRTLLLEEKISLQVDDFSHIVCTDEKWITYILNQILSNAIKYHREDGAWIKISARQAKNGVYLMIEDNGQGIRPQDLPRIFEKGFTGSARDNRKSTGMGLYLCRKLCSKLGLTIDADSVYGKGTTITIGFPSGSFTRPELRDQQ